MSLETVWHPTMARLRRRLFALSTPKRARIRDLGQLYLFDLLDKKPLTTGATLRKTLGFLPTVSERRLALAFVKSGRLPFKWRENPSDAWTVSRGLPRFSGVRS
jgi:hypothetical protein